MEEAARTEHRRDARGKHERTDLGTAAWRMPNQRDADERRDAERYQVQHLAKARLCVAECGSRHRTTTFRDHESTSTSDLQQKDSPPTEALRPAKLQPALLGEDIRAPSS
jgi:hypothetical protein